jgi:hypothetical protein
MWSPEVVAPPLDIASLEDAAPLDIAALEFEVPSDIAPLAELCARAAPVTPALKIRARPVIFA